MPKIKEIKMNHEQVMYKNNDSNLNLSGTLTLPSFDKKSPAVILISGMGPNDRDYTMRGHKLYLELANHLANHGIAVLRFDKRGVGKSEGKFDLTLTSQDFANDVFAGIEYLKTREEINHNLIGLIGHSEGGMIAPIVASRSKDVSFLVLLAGVVTTDIDLNIEQVALQLRVDGATEEIIYNDSKLRKKLLEVVRNEKDSGVAEKQLCEIVKSYLQTLPGYLKKESVKFLFTINKNNYEKTIEMFNSPWYRFLLNYNPVETLKKINVPLLAITGDLDFITSSKISLSIIAKALKNSGNKNYKTVELPKLNHWFQTCKTGAMTEYGKTKETISPIALNLISKWILEKIVHK